MFSYVLYYVMVNGDVDMLKIVLNVLFLLICICYLIKEQVFDFLKVKDFYGCLGLYLVM